MTDAQYETYAGLPVAEPHVIVHNPSPDPSRFAWPLYDIDPLEKDIDGPAVRIGSTNYK